jgi:hypothetical protein
MRACGGGDLAGRREREVDVALAEQARDEVVRSKRLDVDQVVDPRRGQVAQRKGGIEDLDELEDLVRVLAGVDLLAIPRDAVLEVVEARRQARDDGTLLGVAGDDEERANLLLLQILRNAVSGVLDHIPENTQEGR